MRNDTDKGHGLLGGAVTTVLVAVAAVVFLVLLAQTFLPLIPFLGDLGSGAGMVVMYVLLCALVIAAVAVGVIFALVQRWREVKGGEEDEAKKY